MVQGYTTRLRSVRDKHNLRPAGLGSVYPVETSTSLYNLYLYTFVSSRIIWSPLSHRSTTNAPSTHPSSTWQRTPRDEGGGGERWGGVGKERREERERGRGERREGMVRGGRGGKREGGKGGTNWSRDCTLQNPLSTVAVSSTSSGRSHMIPTRNSPVKDYSVLYFDYITKYSV